MVTLDQVIEKPKGLRTEHGGDIEVKVVNYHSDCRSDSIEDMDEAIKRDNQHILIGGESY